MIGPGWMPRPVRGVRRVRVLARVRRRGAKRAAPSASVGAALAEPIACSFDHGPVEFPVATVVPHATSARARVWAGDLQRWAGTQLAWLRPRAIPVVVATLATLAVLAGTDYLRHAHGALTAAHPVTTTITLR